MRKKEVDLEENEMHTYDLVEPIRRGNLSGKNVVQKSTPLFSLWKSDITLAEFKILDTYLSRIDSHKPNERKVVFAKGEFESLIGVKQLRMNDVKERLKRLMSQVVEVKDERRKRGVKLVTLFSMADCEKDQNGQWQIELSCSIEAMEYFFHIESIGYLRYKLRSIIGLGSRYSYILFIYIESNRFRCSWVVDLEELKYMLRCEEKVYEEYKRFNEKILKKSKEELEEKTQLRYIYEPVKNGRKVVAIKFSVSPLKTEMLEEFQEDILDSLGNENKEILSENGTIDFFDEDDDITVSQRMNDPFMPDVNVLLSEACEWEFSVEEINLLFTLITDLPLHHHNGVHVARYHYLKNKYAELQVRDKKNQIMNRFGYIKKIIENDRLAFGVIAEDVDLQH